MIVADTSSRWLHPIIRHPASGHFDYATTWVMLNVTSSKATRGFPYCLTYQTLENSSVEFGHFGSYSILDHSDAVANIFTFVHQKAGCNNRKAQNIDQRPEKLLLSGFRINK